MTFFCFLFYHTIGPLCYISYHYCYPFSSFKLGELVKKIEQELEEANSRVKEKQVAYNDCVSMVLMLEKSIKEHDNNREGRLKDLQKKIKAIKSEVQLASKELKVGFDIAEAY